jgi:hypothetical protein
MNINLNFASGVHHLDTPPPPPPPATTTTTTTVAVESCSEGSGVNTCAY